MKKRAAALTWRESMHRAAPRGRNFGLPTRSLLMLSFAQKRGRPDAKGRARNQRTSNRICRSLAAQITTRDWLAPLAHRRDNMKKYASTAALAAIVFAAAVTTAP